MSHICTLPAMSCVSTCRRSVSTAASWMGGTPGVAAAGASCCGEGWEPARVGRIRCRERHTDCEGTRRASLQARVHQHMLPGSGTCSLAAAHACAALAPPPHSNQQTGKTPGSTPPCSSNVSRARVAAEGLATKQLLLAGSGAAAPPSGDRGVTGRGCASAGGSTRQRCTTGEVVAAHRWLSLLLTARRSTGCCSHATSSDTRLARRVLQQEGGGPQLNVYMLEAWQGSSRRGSQLPGAA